MAFHWLDGIKQLNSGFWRVWLHQPVVCTKLALLTIAVALRDLFLWIYMGEKYLDED